MKNTENGIVNSQLSNPLRFKEIIEKCLVARINKNKNNEKTVLIKIVSTNILFESSKFFGINIAKSNLADARVTLIDTIDIYKPKIP
jgi:hypothetical protein